MKSHTKCPLCRFYTDMTAEDIKAVSASAIFSHEENVLYEQGVRKKSIPEVHSNPANTVATFSIENEGIMEEPRQRLSSVGKMIARVRDRAKSFGVMNDYKKYRTRSGDDLEAPRARFNSFGRAVAKIRARTNSFGTDKEGFSILEGTMEYQEKDPVEHAKSVETFRSRSRSMGNAEELQTVQSSNRSYGRKNVYPTGDEVMERHAKKRRQLQSRTKFE